MSDSMRCWAVVRLWRNHMTIDGLGVTQSQAVRSWHTWGWAVHEQVQRHLKSEASTIGRLRTADGLAIEGARFRLVPMDLAPGPEGWFSERLVQL